LLAIHIYSCAYGLWEGKAGAGYLATVAPGMGEKAKYLPRKGINFT
jgi:hypothetical protein